LIVELKAVPGLDKIPTAQCINYLKATNLHVCLLFNFAKPRLEFKRVISDGTSSPRQPSG
jgi:GxxExxY protein